MAGGTDTNKHGPNISAPTSTPTGASPKRTITVEAVGVVDVVPDECHLLVCVSSSKETVSQAKDSVDRRVRYILQAVQNSQIPNSDVKTFKSVEAGYSCSTELYIFSPDLSKLETLSEVLVNKLADSSVIVHPITFSTSQSTMSRARTQSANSAVQNARRKAADMVRLVEGSLGSPLTIEQISSSEEPSNKSTFTSSNTPYAVWQQSCITVKCLVRVVFDMKPRKS